MRFPSFIALISLLVAESAPAAEPDKIPHLDAEGQQEYANFLAAPLHRAFFIAPGGAWAWSADESSPHLAEAAALETCAEHTEQSCVPYAIDGRVVFDAEAWPGLWGPYREREAADHAPVGIHRGQRFPNLAVHSSDREAVTIADWRGTVVLLHFWGTWCTYCLPELRELQALREELSDLPELAFVLIQVREPFAAANAWLQREDFSLPLYDSGSQGSDDDRLHLADGSKIGDREIARLFPTTYVLDKHGIVLFSRSGPVTDWSEYGPFLRHAATHYGH